MAEIDQGNVHRVSAGADHPDSAVIRCQLMIGTAKPDTLQAENLQESSIPGKVYLFEETRSKFRVVWG